MQRSDSANHRGSTSDCEMSNDDADEMEVDSEGSADGGDSGRCSGGANQGIASGGNEAATEGDSDDELYTEHWNNASGGGGGSSEGGGSSNSSSGGEDLPQLSTSPCVRAVPPRAGIQVAPGKQLFSIRPISNRGTNLCSNNEDLLHDKGDEPLEIKDR